MRFEEGLPSASMFASSTRNLIVIDDLMAETDERVTTLFTKKRHHRNTSVLYLVQNLFPKNKESRTISLNSQYMVVFKNPRDASQMSHLARQMYPGRVKFVQEAFKDATSVPPAARRRRILLQQQVGEGQSGGFLSAFLAPLASSHLARQMYPGRVKFVQEAFKDATSVPYGYLLVDLKQDTPEDMRLRTAIFPDDGVQYVYLPKV